MTKIDLMMVFAKKISLLSEKLFGNKRILFSAYNIKNNEKPTTQYPRKKHPKRICK